MWLAMQDRLQTGVHLKGRNWKWNHRCAVCNTPETTDHILFSCILAKFIWSCIGEAIGWERPPISLQDFMNNWANRGENYNLIIFCLAIVLWGLWTTRNKYSIEEIFPSQPTDVLFKINMWMQKWQVLLKGDHRTTLEDRIKCTRGWLENFLREAKKRPIADDFM